MLRIGRTLAGVHVRCGAHPAGRSLQVAADNSVAPQLFKVGGCEPAAQHLRGDLIKRTTLRSARHVKRRRTRGSTPVLAATTRPGAGHPRPVACTRGARASFGQAEAESRRLPGPTPARRPPAGRPRKAEQRLRAHRPSSSCSPPKAHQGGPRRSNSYADV